MSNHNQSKRRVCVIGAGTAGLCALKHSLEHGLEATAYEQTDAIGGTWVLTDKSANAAAYGDGDGPHSSMYEGLRTNLPKEVMGYPDFLYPDECKESFVNATEVLKFLQSYARNFQLEPHIKFGTEIIRVRPREDEWEVLVRDVRANEYKNVYYDYIFVCNGHYSSPVYPEIPGRDIYEGQQLHSHNYRNAAEFKDASVLVIGCGPSGMDITFQLHKAAQRVLLSHHLEPAPRVEFMANVVQKPDVARFTPTGAIFHDGSSEDFTHVIYCTGYKYAFRCLSTDCGIRVCDNFVQPLYKHCININNPTMALIGLPFNVCPTQLFDLQVRFVLKFYSKQKELPSREAMLEDLERDLRQREARGLSKRQAHQMGEMQFDYYTELSELAGIRNIRPVIVKMMQACGRKYIYELETYRDMCFKVIDDNNFIKFNLNEAENYR